MAFEQDMETITMIRDSVFSLNKQPETLNFTIQQSQPPVFLLCLLKAQHQYRISSLKP